MVLNVVSRVRSRMLLRYFFSGLFSKEDVDVNVQDELLNILSAKLKEESVEQWDEGLTEEELEMVYRWSFI